MPWTEQAQLLLRKAANDGVIVARAVEDAEIADEVVGFHAQQACEKCLKAILCQHGIAYRRTHDLQELSDLLGDAGVSLPAELPELVSWSPYAVAYRYEDWPTSATVDRERAHELVKTVLAWASGSIP